MTQNHDHFKLHIQHAPSHHEEVTHHHREVSSHKTESAKPIESKVKSILHGAFRQVLAFFVFFMIGLVLLNWSAYSTIISYKIQNYLHPGETPMSELLDNKQTISKTVLKTSDDPEVQKKQIPALNLEIAPSDNRIIIPRINQNIPIVRVSSKSLIQRDWNALEKEMQSALKDGVVHYPGTSLPGQSGNVAITGHSSYFPWDPGRFKDVFALLHEVVEGDKIIVYWDQKKFVYQVQGIKVVLPKDIEVLKQTDSEQLTLVTCTPVGTNAKRLIVTAVPVEDDTGKVSR
ncbi:hypothetical protein COU74_02285 [Candidatus Peregrinibacteria bacterium CG10_big_fil_rev_8_21_14_0_10_36_19]|nr:MAG: hypothetical protein COU74_02285 [Candidatus Peregrinibacteria bacterium CG10_big_fil_rev_8_21_14_0_10_36_19]